MVTSNPLHEGKPPTEAISLNESSLSVVPVPERPGTYAAWQRVRLDADNRTDCPYSLDVECYCTMTYTTDMPADDMLRRAYMVAHNVLYSACREAILTATARQAWGEFSLGLSVLAPRTDDTVATSMPGP